MESFCEALFIKFKMVRNKTFRTAKVYTSNLKAVHKYFPNSDKLSYRKNQIKKNGREWYWSRLLPYYFLPSAPPRNRNNFSSNFPRHILWNNGCTDKNIKCDLIKNLTPFCSAAEAEEEKKTKKKTREGNLRHEFVPLFAELFLGYFLWWCGLFWNKKTRRRRAKSFYTSRIK